MRSTRLRKKSTGRLEEYNAFRKKVSQIEAADAVIKQQLVLDKLQTLITGIVHNKRGKQLLIKQKAFHKFKNATYSERKKANALIMFNAFERRLARLLRVSPVAKFFKKWHS